MQKKGSLITVFLAVLIDLMGFGIVLPLLPFYGSQFHATPVQIGLLYSIYSFAQLIFAPFWGGLSDRIGRRPIMLLSTFGNAMAYILFALSNSFMVLFLSRLIAGIMGGNISTAQAYVTDVTSPQDRAKGMGMIGAAFGIGFVLGPAIATLLIHPSFMRLFHIGLRHRFMIPGFFASAMSLLSFLFVLFQLPETITAAEKKRVLAVKTGIFTKRFWQSIFEEKASGIKFLFPLLIFSVFLFSFSQGSLYTSFPLFCKDRLHIPAEQVGLLFVYMGLVAVIIQGGLIRHLTKKFKEKSIFLTGSIIMTASYALIPFSASHRAIIITLCVMSFGASLMLPTLQSLISKEADPKQVGATLGTSQGMGGLGRAVGPMWGGFLYDLSYQLPFLLTAVLLTLTIYVGLQLRRIAKRTVPEKTEF